MPEVISKHPEITLQVLSEAGVQCGVGAPQRILTECPPEQFCSLPTGEICVYGLEQAGEMTQFTSADFARLSAEHAGTVFGAEAYIFMVAALVLGILIGLSLVKKTGKKKK